MIDAKFGKEANARATEQQGPVGNTRDSEHK